MNESNIMSGSLEPWQQEYAAQQNGTVAIDGQSSDGLFDSDKAQAFKKTWEDTHGITRSDNKRDDGT